MGATTKLTFEDYEKLQGAADETARYELDEGELLVTPSPTPYHNEICYRIRRALADFSEAHQLGFVTGETDFRLTPDTVRKPDVAFIGADHLLRIDLERSPVDGAPVLAVEVISPGNSAEDTLKKIHQYLRSGARSVWTVYPSLRLVEIHSKDGVREIEEPEALSDETLLPGFSLSLSYIFDAKKPGSR
jgi:Uma2 family endonuclease